MNSVNKTLYIPLYGKAYVHEKKIILQDPMAKAIWDKEAFKLSLKNKNKYLAYYMGMRSAVFDEWCKKQMELHEDAIILHLGCGLDSRCMRVNNTTHLWYDVDFPSVILERKKYYQEDELYHMLTQDLTKVWDMRLFKDVRKAIIVMEGISMYLPFEQLNALFTNLSNTFEEIYLLMDCYSSFAAKASKYKNPVNEVDVEKVYGLDDPTALCKDTYFIYCKEHEMTPKKYIEQLEKSEQMLFNKLYNGKFAQNLYHLYEFKKEGSHV